MDEQPRYRRILDEVAALRDHLDQLEHEVIHFLRDHKVTWDAIGEGLDPPITRQNASKRFSKPRRRRKG